jgi:tetratricopeptide (TPR) repeat protein
MNTPLQRGLLLYQQGRLEQAEQELRQALALEPDEPYAHALLALCLSKREQFDAATQEARQAIHLAPDFGFAHYALAWVLDDRHRWGEALAAIQEALRLEPEDADYCALEAQIHFNQRLWPGALEAAERGLRSEPDHVSCTNLRAMALVKLGRKAEAGATIDAALARNPDDAVTHANRGWSYLEQNEPLKALEHFREALRLDPENEWARLGIIEALKARNLVYGFVLRYFLWMSKLSARLQWGVIIGGYLGNRLLASAAREHPELRPWILPLRILYIAFVLLTWTADPLFNLLLRLNRFGRLALSREQIVASNWVGLCVLLAALSLLGCVVLGFDSPLLLSGLVFGLLIIPMAGTFHCGAGWPRRVMAAYTAVMALVGLAMLGLEVLTVVQGGVDGVSSREVRAWVGGLMGTFLLAAFVSPWAANFLMMQRTRR